MTFDLIKCRYANSISCFKCNRGIWHNAISVNHFSIIFCFDKIFCQHNHFSSGRSGACSNIFQINRRSFCTNLTIQRIGSNLVCKLKCIKYILFKIVERWLFIYNILLDNCNCFVFFNIVYFIVFIIFRHYARKHLFIFCRDCLIFHFFSCIFSLLKQHTQDIRYNSFSTIFILCKSAFFHSELYFFVTFPFV